ncbi:MAG: twin-arginine translocation signal domain-containing protein, partial [Planctomycetota bacterium]|nr:twin-arginine translocation signal domain-containing protein [Planctomycetota bacterium]
MLTRRDFVQTAATATTVASTVSLPAAQAAVQEKTKRKTMAIVSTEWRFHSHAQHMGDRFLHGYPTDGVWNQPRLDVVSLYADQVPKNDLSR